MPYPAVFWTIALMLVVLGIVEAIRARAIAATILILTGLVLGLVSGNYAVSTP